MNDKSKVYIISDLHLSLSVDKPMDIFGDNWSDYVLRLENSWKSIVSDADYVIVPGDISWGMTIDEAAEDLRFLNSLPGKKILMKGNHEYWWNSLQKLNRLKADLQLDTLFFMHTNSFYIEELGIAVVGTRGWKCPDDRDFSDDDMKVYKREVLRLEMSIKDAEKYNPCDMICVFHYPPFDYKAQPSAFTELMKKYGIGECFFGHLHGITGNVFKTGDEIPVFASPDGVVCRLVSSDYLSFSPVKIR